jgi:hypothetical protein
MCGERCSRAAKQRRWRAGQAAKRVRRAQVDVYCQSSGKRIFVTAQAAKDAAGPGQGPVRCTDDGGCRAYHLRTVSGHRSGAKKRKLKKEREARAALTPLRRRSAMIQAPPRLFVAGWCRRCGAAYVNETDQESGCCSGGCALRTLRARTADG